MMISSLLLSIVAKRTSMAGEVPEVTTTRSGEIVTLIFIKVVLTDCFSQFKKSKTMSVMGLSISHSPVACFPDALRCIKIGFTNFKMNDILASPLHLLGFFKDIHDNERKDLRCSFCYH